MVLLYLYSFTMVFVVKLWLYYGNQSEWFYAMHTYRAGDLFNAQMSKTDPPTSVINTEMLVLTELVQENHRHRVIRIETQT